MIKKVVAAIEIFALRNYVVGGDKGNKYEVFFANIAFQISNNKFMIDDVLREITDKTMDDKSFCTRLIGLEIKTTPIAKYILREIEDYGNPEKKTNRDTQSINLEHIMPKNINNWTVPKEVHKKYLYRLGNLTLMLDEYNRKASNKPFNVKKENYKKSKLSITYQLLKYQEWTPEAIESRERELIEVIKKRWALVT